MALLSLTDFLLLAAPSIMSVLCYAVYSLLIFSYSLLLIFLSINLENELILRYISVDITKKINNIYKMKNWGSAGI